MSESSEHLKVVDGLIWCRLCSGAKFSTKNEALEHVREHDACSDAEDFEASDSDEATIVDESSDDTEGSSGVESSEVDEPYEQPSDLDESSSAINSQAKTSSYDSPEVKYGRSLMSEYLEELRDKDISTKSIRWTKAL